ncbi:hypothetical protein C9374_003549 [Naegleria lovaniensis]|uniref:Glycosyltransferase n=1 Tax=Naegleria lovaniensis TaxID=51637 RepID=A0AA88GZG9_NAELO|nr:uncharacterized protein C9374_003549 [Naegleria lovaniensis]KAG2393785.1 hypothetical protein C9374_003549 [Naegleria lovaniensis]
MFSDDFLPAATGVGIHCQIICRHLVCLGHCVSVVTCQHEAHISSTDKYTTTTTHKVENWQVKGDNNTLHDISIYRVPSKKIFGFYQALPSEEWIEQFLLDFQPHVVHHHYLGFMCKRAIKVVHKLRNRCSSMINVPSSNLSHIYTYHMTLDHLTQPFLMKMFKPWIRGQISKLCNSVDMIISVSKNLVQEIPTQAQVHSRIPIKWISNPVDSLMFNVDQVIPVARQAKFQVLFVGRLNPEKNLPLLLRGFASFLKMFSLQTDTNENAVLWIAGSGSDEKKLVKLCERLHIEMHVKFLGFLESSSLSTYYKACDVFVLPSFVETQGLAAMEAMSFSKPVIVSQQIVSCLELLDKLDSTTSLSFKSSYAQELQPWLCQNGFMVDAHDDQQLAQQLYELYLNAEMRVWMGDNSRRKTQQFRPQVILKQLLDAYNESLLSCKVNNNNCFL